MASSSGCAPVRVEPSSLDAGARAALASPLEGLGTDERPSAHGDRQRPEAPPQGHRFPRALRLTSRRQFQAVYAHGLRVASPAFVIFGKPNGLDHCRVGLTLTRKTGGAVVRNRAKRVLREVFRRNLHRLGQPMDLVINGRRDLLQRTVAGVEREFLDSVARLERRVGR